MSSAAQQQPHQANKRSIIVLHGSRQTGDLLLGRMDKLRKRLAKAGYVLVAPTAPFGRPENDDLRDWWIRHDNDYQGFLQQSLPLLQQTWQEAEFTPIGFLGFSQGARLAHLLTVLHERQPARYFSGLQLTIMVAGYVAPSPDGMDEHCPPPPPAGVSPSTPKLRTRSLHVWGTADQLITAAQSQALAALYASAATEIHDGGHHVPMRAANVRAYVDFVEQAVAEAAAVENGRAVSPNHTEQPQPDEETKQTQQDEVEAMEAIFPDEFQLLSSKTINDDDEVQYDFPIQYQIALPPTDEGVWPPRPLTLRIRYPPTYPHDGRGPELDWIHENNVMEFSTAQREACAAAMKDAMQAEEGMPCVYSCYAAAKDFFESGVMAELVVHTTASSEPTKAADQEDNLDDDIDGEANESLRDGEATIHQRLPPCSPERARLCNQQGLEISASILKHLGTVKVGEDRNNDNVHVNGNVLTTTTTAAADPNHRASDQAVAANQLKGGHWTYTIGLVGKPSAGKSTFFNAATAFARQRYDTDNLLGGATMAPHPFTTIDANRTYPSSSTLFPSATHFSSSLSYQFCLSF